MGVLMTDELTIGVEKDGVRKDITVCYGDYFKALYEKAFEEFGIEPMDQPTYGLYEPDGAKLPKSAQIYNTAEVSDGVVVELRKR